MTTLTIRQNFHEEVEAAINRQINMELRASYVYQSMVCFRKNINFFTIRLSSLIYSMLNFLLEVV